MKYLKYIGKKANKASESLKYVSHDKIQKTLNTPNRSKFL